MNGSNAHIRNWLSLTVLNNGNSYSDSVNADGAAADVPQKYPSIAFSPVDGTGYIVFRTKHGGGFTSDLREIPPAYNGTTNKNLGRQITISDKLGYTLDQPAVSVGSDGTIYVVGYGVTVPVTLRLITMRPSDFSVTSDIAIDSQPGGENAEMDPQMCMDGNNVHVTAQFPYGTASDSPVKEYAYDRIVGGGFVKTMITPPGWIELRGNKSKDMSCQPDGTTYVAINNTGQLDLYKRLPGPGSTWNKTAANVMGIYADDVAVTVSSDGRVWVAQADQASYKNDPNGSYGANVKFSTDGGFTFSANERAISNSNDPQNANFLSLTASSDNKVHLLLSSQYDYSNYTSRYAYAVTTTPPAAPTNVVATSAGTNQVNVTWTASTSPTDSYKVYRSTDNVNFSLVAQGVTGTSYNDTSVSSATTYFYRISAVKGSLEGPQSASSNAATTLLGVPFNLGGTAVSSTEIDLTWGAPSPAPDSYNVYRSTNPSSGFSQINGSPVTTTSYHDTTGLLYGTTYYYKVTAIKAGFAESAASNVAGIATLGPSSVVFLNTINNGTAGTALNNFSVKVVDSNGNIVTNYSGPVTITITPASGNPNAVITGTTNKNATNGTADFTGANLIIDTIGTGYQLRATANNGAYGDSNSFNQSGTLAVSTAPSGLHATDPFTITVTVQNNGGTDAKYNGPVTLNLTTLPSGAYTYGMPSVNAVSGVANFRYLMGDTAGTYNYTATLGNAALAPDVNAPAVNLVAYANTTPCTRILVTTPTTAGGSDTCTATTVQTALNTAHSTTIIPVYVDHRAGPVGFGAAPHPDNASLTIPAGSILDGGCTTADGQGLTMTIFNGPGGLTVSGSNNYLRGIFFSGDNSTTALFNLSGSKGNLMSCDKVQFVSGP